ncbi:hypothetical protein WAI453_011797 [Rhynchosporium graminicola]
MESFFPEDRQIPISESIFQSWSREAAPDVANLKYVTVADFDPPGFRAVFRLDIDHPADRDAFAALAGMDNTRNVFYMLTDHKGSFQGKRSTMIHTSTEPETGGSAMHVTFELAD